MMRKRITTWIVMLCLCALPCAASEATHGNCLEFKPNEAESMLALFNQTMVSGGDVELIAGLGEKLATGFQEAKKLKNPARTIILPLNTQEIRYCLAIIGQSTFQAKYARLILGIKKKLTALLPEPEKSAVFGKEKK